VFDYRNLGYMTQEEFSHFLFSYIGKQAECETRAAVHLFQRHDVDKDGRINYAEFCRIMVPKIDKRL